MRWGTALSSPAGRLEDLVVRDQDGMHGRPGARVQGYLLNSAGTRGPEFAVPKPEGSWRVVVAGASEMFGLTEPPGREVARQLEEALRAGCTDHRVDVVNTAMPGMTLPTVVQDLRRRVPRFGPDVVVYYPTPSQYLGDSLPRPAVPGGTPIPLSPWSSRAWPRISSTLRDLLPDALVQIAAERAWERAGRGRPAGWRFDLVPPDRLARFDADLRTLVGAARAAGGMPGLVIHAHPANLGHQSGKRAMLGWLRRFPRATPEVLIGFDSAAALVTATVARDSATLLIDPRGPLGAPGRPLFADHAHFTAAGAGVLAALVAGVLTPVPGC